MKRRKFINQIALTTTLLATGKSAHLMSQNTYDGRIGENKILTPLPSKEPKINGPKVYGARQGKKFVYRIPCHGQRPIQFKIKDLPNGMILDSVNGVISGITPKKKGSYKMSFTAKNQHGDVTRSFTLHIGEKIALTPPTGWNSWGGHMINVSDKTIRKAADIFVNKGLADAGFQYIGIDDCWNKIPAKTFENRNKGRVKRTQGFNFKGIVGVVRDKDGKILTNKKFPDMKALCDYVHGKGLKAGIYSSPGPLTCQNYAGSIDHEKIDAEQYASWGFDLLKYDKCSAKTIINGLKKANPNYKVKNYWKTMSDHLQDQDRDILYNLCQYGDDDPWTWTPEIGIQSWRIGGDLNMHIKNYFKQALKMVTTLRPYSKPGQWNDPDFMYIHKIRNWRKMTQPSREIPLSTNQRYQYVTLWSIICAPFFFSCDIDNINEFTLRLIGNSDVLNINQDELGSVAKVIRNDDKTETVMVKKMTDGSKVLAVFNRNAEAESDIKVTWKEIGLSGTQKVFDVWRRKDVGKIKDGLSVKLSPDGVALFTLTP